MSTNSTATGKWLSLRRSQIRRQTDCRIRSASGSARRIFSAGCKAEKMPSTVGLSAAGRPSVSACSRATVSAAGPEPRPVRVPLPRGELGQLAGWPTSKTASKAAAARRSSAKPQALPTSMHCWSRSRKCLAAALAPMLPGTSAGERTPQAAATSSAHCSESHIALPQYGRTIPVVPRIDRPPSIPSRGLNVFRPPRVRRGRRPRRGRRRGGPFFGEKGLSARASPKGTVPFSRLHHGYCGRRRFAGKSDSPQGRRRPMPLARRRRSFAAGRD